MNKKVFVVGSDFSYTKFLKNIIIVKELEDADIVLFTGGADVSPLLYNEAALPLTYCDCKRDVEEIAEFEKISKNQLAIGICRGSQLLCALNGGKIIQHVKGHGIWGTHSIVSKKTDTLYEITSTHHQMQYPYNLDPSSYDLLYTSKTRYSNEYLGGPYINVENIIKNGEPEIVYYHVEGKPKCLAIQGHPEMMNPNSITVSMINNLIDDILNSIKK